MAERHYYLSGCHFLRPWQTVASALLRDSWAYSRKSDADVRCADESADDAVGLDDFGALLRRLYWISHFLRLLVLC